MTDLSDVISGLGRGPSTLAQPFGKCPTTHKQVNISGAGFIDDRYRMTNSGMRSRVPTTLQEAERANEQILKNGFLRTAGVVAITPAVFDPRRSFIECTTSTTGGVTWTFPTAEQVIAYMKSFYGVQNVVAGFSWTVTIFTNDPTGTGVAGVDTLTLDFATAGPGTNVFGNNGGATPGVHILDIHSSCEMTVVLDYVQNGIASVAYYIH